MSFLLCSVGTESFSQGMGACLDQLIELVDSVNTGQLYFFSQIFYPSFYSIYQTGTVTSMTPLHDIAAEILQSCTTMLNR
ncbi:MAG: hypothetical protein CPDRYMAC_6903 [uncultured Paraburkholderia sp.]|nr:MAG: hypothetical protein CPDRYDRY_6871 [uncultured Paraburkholderia sp.]CAH2945517.1 MAG: hypothetical protein CPDRYMAC_6903 [uncultured Paraburkholderia sp.]